MSIKLPWVRNFYQEWIMDFAGTDAAEKATYSTLTALMYRACEPIYDDTSVLARIVGCSVRTFKKSLEKLIRKKLILQLENGNLWSTQVEEELKNCNENLDKVSKASRANNSLSERAKKAAQARWSKHTNNACDDAKAPENTENYAKNDAKNAKCDIKHIKHDFHDAKNDAYGMLNDAYIYNINNNTNINSNNKKTNTIVLAKKETDFEDLEIHDQVDELIEVDAVETTSEQIETVSENQPPLHEQESVPKKAKRVKANRGCRLPADFEPDYDFALAEGLPPERVKVEIAKFRDYWTAKSGKDASKIDWQATWRNWVRNSKDYQKNKQGGNYGNYSQRQKSISERLSDSVLDIGSRGYFEAHSRNDSPGVPFGFEGWQCLDQTAGIDCFRSL
ncbi:hypothetical protein HNQ69_001638 [Bartonella callosciuri]|uniref:Phage related protein n=1 Tax=Bartonella callosciuri TaxID=686223 RepID=A0A840NP06_9HYPH|nr:DUF1376 domain-containing protein [Bartonella callosciuri]MBB5074486.1 hypothetical protein [Bartonella callosciuri]